MAIKSLESVISRDLITKLARVSGDSSATAAASGKAKMQGQALYASLRSGAKHLAAGVQLLNSGISFVNVSLDLNEKLLSIVEDLKQIVDKANKGNISGTSARKYKSDFEALADKFDGIIAGSKQSEFNALDVSTLEDSLVRAGLDDKKISELATMLRRITQPNDAVVDAQGNVTADGNPIPSLDFERSLKAAIYDEDDPTDDKSGFFGRAKAKLKEVELRLQTNVKALNQTRDLVKDNLDLVRATGIAFFEVSNEMTGSESVDQILDTIRSRVRGSAPQVMGQVHNLDGVIVAGLASLNAQS
jgi:hypothetical protein